MFYVLFAIIHLASSLTLHIVPHSHCDNGWKETVEWYYDRKVRHILNNVLSLLESNPSYKFSWAETSFLKEWMEEQSESTQQRMRALIQQGSLEIVGGGFVQHDEALTNFEEVIRQIETGHNYLRSKFGLSHIKIAWQIDAFGHSALTPAILSKFGFEYLVGSRIDSEFKVIYNLEQTH